MPVAIMGSSSTPQKLQTAVLPDEIIIAAESQWLLSEEELQRTPSILDGLSPDKERENRSKGVNFILQVGIMLRLPQITLATASVFLHRFYIRYSMQDTPSRPGHHYYSMAATSLFLATKVEECCRKMKDLVIACVRVAQKDPYKTVDEQDKEYWRWRDNILLNEDLLLEALCFDLRLEPPYKTLYDLLLRYGEENNKKLRNAAWAFISDSCLTPLCLLFPSRTIAASALYAAARQSSVSFPDSHTGLPWWESVGASVEDIARACDYMANVYQSTPAKPGRDNSLYERMPRGLDGNQDVTRHSRPRTATESSLEQEPRRSGKRELEEQTELDSKANGDGSGPSGDANESSHKRQRLQSASEHNPQRNVGVSSTSSSQTLPPHLSLPDNPASQSQHASTGSQASVPGTLNGINEQGNGRSSPRADDGSEEGEVES